MKRASLVMVLLAVVLLVLGGCGTTSVPTSTVPPGTTQTPTTESTQTTTPTSTPATTSTTASTPAPSSTQAPTQTAEPVPEPEPITIKGTGDKASAKFELLEGVSTFEMSHDGTANFIVHLMSDSGETVDFLANSIGRYEGVKAIGVEKEALLGAEPGIHLLNIQADGSWTIIIRQPRFSSAPGLPQNFSGKGDSVSRPFLLSAGLATFTFSHDGSSNFIVHLLSAKGEVAEYLVNEIGSYEGSKAVGVKKGAIIGPEPGIYLLAITADGNWAITIE